jgi:hypothetical protein
MAGNPRPNIFHWSCAEKSLVEKKVTDPLQDGQGVESSQHIVGHDADAAGQRFAFVDRERF